MTHDINADPEMWELRDKYGDRAGFVWLECLSIADRNEGLVGPDSPQLHAVLASKCRVYSPKVRSILEWCLGKGWLEVRPILTPHFGTSSSEVRECLVVVKWAKYNKTRVSEQPASYTTPNQTRLNKKKIAPSHRNVTPPAPWPPDDLWLSELLKKQVFCSHCGDQLQDYQWWEFAAVSLGGIDRPFIEREFAKINAWWRENPTKRKTANGMRRFIRTWLEKAKNEQGRLYAVKR